MFAAALNTSHLESFSLTTNTALGDTFIASFLPSLDCPSLHEMHLSVLGLTRASAPHIVEYISSHRCSLHTLKANGNRLGLRAVRAIIKAVHRRNFTLQKLELYANGLDGASGNGDGSATSGEESEDTAGLSSTEIWKVCESELKRALMRNEHLKKATEREALALLRTARTVLLQPKRPAAPPHPASEHSQSALILAPSSRSTLFSSIGQPVSVQPPPPPTPTPTFPFTRLPTELQLHILASLAPTLSSAQRIRIYQYASARSTLPALLPCLPSGPGGGGCIPDPSSMPFGAGAGAGTKLRRRPGALGAHPCAGGRCMGAGSVRCAREEERARWLAAVRCNAFELEEDGSGDLDELAAASLGPD